MMLLLCCALLQIIIVKGGYVDIVLQSDNFTGVINLTADGYTGFFSKLIETELPACQFGYLFGVTTVNVSSTPCSSLNITDFGKSFECGEVNSTIFQCKRMGEMSSCEYNKSWFVFYNSNSTSSKQCAGICLTNTEETFNVSYQINITRVSESACPRPTDTTTKTPSAAISTISETPTSKSVASVKSYITTQSIQLISSNSTIYVNYEANENIKDVITLIAGLCAGGGVLIIFIVAVIVVCVKRRTMKNGNNVNSTNDMGANSGDTNGLYDISKEKIRDDSILKGRELSKLSGIEFDVMDDIKAGGDESTHNNYTNTSRIKPSYLETDQVIQIDSDINNKHNQADSFVAKDKDTGYLEVNVPKLDDKSNDKTSTTSHSYLGRIDSEYERVGGTENPISNIYARLGESVREFENPYNETSDSNNNLRQTGSEHVNVKIETNQRHFSPDTLKILQESDDVIVVESNDVYAQVTKTKKPHVAISYV